MFACAEACEVECRVGMCTFVVFVGDYYSHYYLIVYPAVGFGKKDDSILARAFEMVCVQR